MNLISSLIFLPDGTCIAYVTLWTWAASGWGVGWACGPCNLMLVLGLVSTVVVVAGARFIKCALVLSVVV